MKLFLAYLLVFSPMLLLSQAEYVNVGASPATPAKGDVYITWGYNRASYNPSDIRFKGEGFDFTLYEVYARDMPEPFDPQVYFNPTKLTIPQFNFRAGFYISPRSSISAGWDHMKYRIIDWQSVRVDGSIDPELYPDYLGINTDVRQGFVQIDPRFIKLEHSDGLNFIRVAYEYQLPVWQSMNGKQGLSIHGAASVGAVMPWTDFTFMNERYRNFPHIAGYGVSGLLSARFQFFEHLFLQFQMQHGWLNLPDIVIQDESSSRASQQIVFQERSWSIGGYIPIFRKKFATSATDQ